MKVLGLDIGTTTISAVVHHSEKGVIAAKTIENDTFLPGEAWERKQDSDAIYQKASNLVRQLLEEHPDVEALGMTGQMHGILYLDANGDAVSPLYTWQDGRGNLPYDDTESWAAHLSRVTGSTLATGYGMVTHVYNLHHGLVPPNAVTFCTIYDYVAMKLAGRTTPALEPTDAASLGFYDSQNGCFDWGALEHVGVDSTMVPPMMTEPCLGTGCLGIPVYAGIGDNQASFLGATGGRTDVLLANVGTGGQISVYSPIYLQTDLLETRPFPDGGWLLVGASLCAGRAYAMLENFFRQTVKMVTGQEVSAYEAMGRALDQAGEMGDFPRVTTAFQGTRKDPDLRGAIEQIGEKNFTPEHLICGFMDGMAQELYRSYCSYLNMGGKAPAAMIGSGNGLRKNPHLCRVFEKTFGCPMTLSQNQEEAATGAAIYAEKHLKKHSR